MDTCECGSVKRPGQAACERCEYLDGTRVGEAKIIGSLRERGGIGDMYQIAADVGLTVRSVQRGIRELKRSGRVYRITPHVDGMRERVLWVLIDRMPASQRMRG